MFLHVYVRFTRQDQVAIPTDVWIPLGCFVTTDCWQSLLSSAKDTDKFVSDPNSAPPRVSDGALDENECSTLSCSRSTSWEISRYSLNRRPNSSQCLSVRFGKGKNILLLQRIKALYLGHSFCSSVTILTELCELHFHEACVLVAFLNSRDHVVPVVPL
jgi:hypothetical protein